MFFKFNYEEKEYLLDDEKLDEFYNDEEIPVNNFQGKDILRLMKESSKEIEFENAYYSLKCSNCDENKVEGERAYKYLEYHFYIYTKNNEYIISDISKEYDGLTFAKLEKMGKVDNGYIVSIIVCKNCGKYTIELENIEI